MTTVTRSRFVTRPLYRDDGLVSCFGVREEIVKEIEVFEILGDYCSSVVATVFWLAFFTACRAEC